MFVYTTNPEIAHQLETEGIHLMQTGQIRGEPCFVFAAHEGMEKLLQKFSANDYAITDRLFF